MAEPPQKSGSGCKTIGCGCLILVALLALGAGLAVFFFLRTAAPGKLQAHHFLPSDAVGTIHLNLHKDDEGLAALFSLILKEGLMSTKTDVPPWLNGAFPELSKVSLHSGPVGPHVLISLPPETPPGQTVPLIVVDLNSYPRAAAIALQVWLKSSMGAAADPVEHHGITLYDTADGLFDFALHKGFLLAAGDLQILRAGIDAMTSANAADYPEKPPAPAGCDIYADWHGDFSTLILALLNTLQLEPPKDSNAAGHVQALHSADLCLDAVSEDAFTFTLQATAQTVEAAHQVHADLQEQARKLQTFLTDFNLDLKYATRLESRTAILEGDLHGLASYLKTLLQPPEENSDLPDPPPSGE